MTFPSYYQHQNYNPEHPVKDPAVVGRLGGGYPVPASGWYDSLYGIGAEGIGVYTGVNMDSPRARESTVAGSSRNPAPATGEAAGPM